MSVPTSADDVFFDGVGTGASNATLNTSSSVNSIDMTGYANTLTHNAGVTLTHAGNGTTFKLAGTYTLGNAATSALSFTGTSGTTTINTNGKTIGNVTFNGTGGTFQFTGNVTTTGIAWTRTNGTVDLTTNSVLVSFTGAGAVAITGTMTWYDLTRTGTAVKTDTFTATAAQTVNNQLTCNGNSATNRVLFASSTIGTARTWTCTLAPSLTNTDFRDITTAGAGGTWAGTSLGDCGGNTGITPTTPTTRYGVVAGNFSNTATWSTTTGGGGGASVPLPQDTVVFDNGSAAGTYTVDMPRAGGDLSITSGFTRTLGTSTNHDWYGNITLGANMLISGTNTISLMGRTNKTFTSNGITMTQPVQTTGPANYTLQDAFASSNTLTLNNLSTFTTGGFSVTTTGFSAFNGSTISHNGTTYNLTGTSGAALWDIRSVTYTGTPNVSFTTASTNARSVSTSGFAIGTLDYTVAGSTGQMTVTSGCTIATLNFSDATNVRTISFTASNTFTISTAFNVGGTGGGAAAQVMSIVSSTPGTFFTLSKTSGRIWRDYLSIQDSHATGGAAWFAGSHSTDVSGNTGWIFADPSLGNSTLLLLGVG